MRAASTDMTRNLSASGSMNMPNSDSCLSFRALHPSSRSVSDAAAKRIRASHHDLT